MRKSDVTIAKNYLTQEEINAFNRIVTMWLDFAEDQALMRKQIFLRDWQEKLDQFLEFNNRQILQGSGHTSNKSAEEKARAEYEIYAERRRALKETEGERSAIEALRSISQKSRH